MRPIVITALLALALTACRTGDPDPVDQATQGGAQPTTVEPWTQRDQWQRPQEVIAMMGGDLSGMTIADLFADDGYFTFKLIDAGANVIAIENDPEKVARLEALKRAKGLGDDRLVIRAVPVGDPGIAPEEVDMALIVHRFVDLQDKETYFKLMRRGLRYPRPLVVIEWMPGEVVNGPPLEQRRTIDQLMDDIGELDYADVGAHSNKIPEQVVLFSTDPMDDMPEAGAPLP